MRTVSKKLVGTPSSIDNFVNSRRTICDKTVIKDSTIPKTRRVSQGSVATRVVCVVGFLMIVLLQVFQGGF